MSTTRTIRCVGIIMDGNRRYAKSQGLPNLVGHQLGYDKIEAVANWCKEAGIGHLILYAFSSENWNRSPEEVAYLIDIFKTKLLADVPRVQEEGGAVRFIGEIERFGEAFAKQARALEGRNPPEPILTIVVALSYGGRPEIVRAANRLLVQKPAGPITEQDFARELWTSGLPDPDLIIRTGGEKRLSNFLPWQSVYSELFFVDTYWPAFTREEFFAILDEYAARERRMGA